MSNDKILYEQTIFELEKKLLQSVNELNNCKKENEDLIHIASHDLQAPLRKLSTFIERLTSKYPKELGEEVSSYIERIEATLQDMRSLIDDLSALSDIQETHTDFVKYDLNEAVKETMTDLKLLIKEKNVDISVASLPVIEANQPQLKQVFRNLFDNSIKFQNKASPKIVITSELINTEEKTIFNLPDNKIYHKIEFEDNGIGFNSSYNDEILKPFKRLHGKAAYKGNGLGLAICKKIIENHQGRIYAKGNENSGARFVLILPETHN